MSIKIDCHEVRGATPQQFRRGGRQHHNVRIFLSGPAAEMEEIESVEYVLHPTFKDRYRVSTNRTRNFEVRIWTYGYFDVQATITKRNGSTEVVSGFVRW